MAQKKKYYAVKHGRKVGVFTTWDECKKQVDGYSGAEYKSFPTEEEAKLYICGEKKKTVSSDCAVAYVDGSYLHSKRMFSFGAVFLYNGEEKYFKEAFSDNNLASMRNVAGEIKGAEFVMKYCAENNIADVEIYYDYAGIEKWCSGEWQANKEGTMAYRDIYKKYSKQVNISFHKVKGHSGDKYNDMADSLAKAALGIE